MTTKKISYYGLCFGIFCCFLGIIWSPEESVKWFLSAVYLYLVGRWFGVTYRTEKVKGMTINRGDKPLNYLNLRDRK